MVRSSKSAQFSPFLVRCERGKINKTHETNEIFAKQSSSHTPAQEKGAQHPTPTASPTVLVAEVSVCVCDCFALVLRLLLLLPLAFCLGLWLLAGSGNDGQRLGWLRGGGGERL